MPLSQPLIEPLSPALTRLADRLSRHRPAESAEPDRRWAAVALILAPAPDALLLIRRAERAGDPWSGQIGLPGGRRAPADADLAATAMRESAEEVGIDLARAHLLGSLTDVVPRTPVLPPIAVRPFVFALARRPEAHLNPEVASAHWVELHRLAEAEARQHAIVHVRGAPLEVPAYMVDGMVVWGMTERILNSFFEVISGK